MAGVVARDQAAHARRRPRARGRGHGGRGGGDPGAVRGGLGILAALLYSGGPRPYAGLGLGEVMVFMFFGLVATCGTTFVMVETVTAAAWWCGAVMGLLAVAILEANNIRDIGTDEAAGKRTLAVRLGDPHARALYGTMVVGAFGTIVAGVLAHLLNDSVGLTRWGLVGLAAWPPPIPPPGAAPVAGGPPPLPPPLGAAHPPPAPRPAPSPRVRLSPTGTALGLA